MSTETKSLEQELLKKSLLERPRATPAKLEFYDLGAIRRDFFPRWLEEPKTVFSMEIEGDESGTCLITFEQEPKDLSMAAEMANIICAKTIALWSELSLEPWEISTPRFHEPQERSFHSMLLILTSLPRARVISQSYTYAIEAKTRDGSAAYREKNRLQMVFFPKTQILV